MHFILPNVLLLGLVLLTGVLGQRLRITGRRPGPPNQSRTEVGNSGRAGLCRFGRHAFGCCYGWKRNHFGECSPLCQEGCVHGTCVAPNQCRCQSGYSGNKCEIDFNECSARPCSHRCMNTPGSFRCYCEHGFLLLSDGTSCSRDDRCSATRCSFGCIQYEDGFTCFCPDGLTLLPDGLGCTDIDECETGAADCPTGRRCRNTYGNYMCLCPLGYKFAYVDSVLDCVDENECDTNRCDRNAYCVNVLGGFQCKCNDGFVGDGSTCAPIDSTTCLDEPCFQDVTCTDVAIASDTMPVDSTTAFRQYKCGECPPTYDGDGEVCRPSTVTVTLVVVSKNEANTPLGGVSVKVLLDKDDGQTEVAAEGTTDPNGIANLIVPSGTPIAIVATKNEYVDTIKSYQARTQGVNAVQISMERFSELTSFLYRNATSKAFEFGGGGAKRQASDFRVSFPEGALLAADLDTVTVNYKRIDLSNPDSMSAVPDMTRVEGSDVKRLIPLGIAELTILDTNGANVELSKPASLSFNLTANIDVLGDGATTAEAFYFDTEKGIWIKDGTGDISETADGLVWTYKTFHFTWWSVAVVVTLTDCLTVRACYDEACTLPAVYVPIILTSDNPHFYEEHDTGPTGSVCINAFNERITTVKVTQNCTSESKYASADLSAGSVCASNPEDSTCQVVKFVLHDTASSECLDPGEPANGLRFGDNFSLGSSVTYYCDQDYKINGNSQRVCSQCGKWSGFQPFCTINSFSSDSEGSGSNFLEP